MLENRKRILAATLMILTVVLVPVGVLSFISIASLGHYWVPGDEHKLVTRVTVASSRGRLSISLVREPRSYYEQIVQIPSPFLSQNHRWNCVLFWTRSPAIWWFNFRSGNFVMPILTTRPVKPSTSPVSYYYVAAIGIPYWILVLVVAPYPAIRLLDLRNRKLRARFAAGQCLACGYDLRHSPDRCPECGAVPSTAPPAPARLLDFIPNISRGLLFRIIIVYPIFFVLFTALFSYAYLSHYRR